MYSHFHSISALIVRADDNLTSISHIAPSIACVEGERMHASVKNACASPDALATAAVLTSTTQSRAGGTLKPLNRTPGSDASALAQVFL